MGEHHRKERLETRDLILKKATYEDWKAMYANVWSHQESAKYMHWNVMTSQEEAKIRILKTIEYQKSHDSWLIFDRLAGIAIGFAGVEQAEPGIWRETGICIGPMFTEKGFGKQILCCLMDYCREDQEAYEFWYSCREHNEASKALAESMGLTLRRAERKTDERDGSEYLSLKYSIKLRDNKRSADDPAAGGTHFMRARGREKEKILQLYQSQVGSPCCPWDDDYPSMYEIESDLSRGDLYVLKDENGELIASISIDREEEIEELTCWSKNLQPAASLSRLAVAKDLQNQGIARQMMQHAMGVLRKRGYKSVHFLVNRKNEKAIRSYAHMEFHVVGECQLFEQDFLCYEKEL